MLNTNFQSPDVLPYVTVKEANLVKVPCQCCKDGVFLWKESANTKLYINTQNGAHTLITETICYKRTCNLATPSREEYDISYCPECGRSLV